MRQISHMVLSVSLLIAGTAPAVAGEAPGFIRLEKPMSAPRGYIDMCSSSAGPLCDSGQASETLHLAAETSDHAELIVNGATGAVTQSAKRVAVLASPTIQFDVSAAVPEFPSLAFETRFFVGKSEAQSHSRVFNSRTPVGQVFQPNAEPRLTSRCGPDQSAELPFADISNWLTRQSVKCAVSLACQTIKSDEVAFGPELRSLSFDTHAFTRNGGATLFLRALISLTTVYQVFRHGVTWQPISGCGPDQSAALPFSDFPTLRARRFQGEGILDSGASAADVAAPAAVGPMLLTSKISSASLKMLHKVNLIVNRRVTQRTDQQMFGRGEVWRRTGIGRGAQGDCEDLAIEKRLELLEMGFSADRLFFGVVYRGDIGLHTILVARADDGDYVMDSLTSRLLRWTDAPYSWISVQAPGRPNHWFSVGSKRNALPSKIFIVAQNPSESGTGRVSS